MRAPIGVQIRRKRLAAGLSQAALARAVGISASYLNLIENNKRSIGGKLLLRISERLRIDPAALSGASESRAIQAIEELLGDPAVAGIEFERTAIRDLVARFPEAGTILMRLYRAYVDATAEIEAYQHRTKSDPLLSQLLHQVLNRIAAMKSGAEILAGVANLTPEEQTRFITTINAEAQALAPTVRNLASYFDRSLSRRKPVSPLTDVDEAIIARNNHFPELEDVADILRREICGDERLSDAALAGALEKRFGIACREQALEAPLRGQYRYDAEQRVLWFSESIAPSTRIFQTTRLYALHAATAAIEETAATLELNSDEARILGRRALSSYVAGAMMMPYRRFLTSAEERRYDIGVLSHRFAASFEQVAHRLVTLRRKGEEGVPFGFLRADRSGRLTKRFPLPGLVLPNAGHGCLLWPIYATSAGGGIIRQVSEFPGGGRFLLVAKTVAKQVVTYREQPQIYSVMLACDVLHADRTIYGQGIDLREAPTRVGPSCPLCSHQECAHRQETPV